ncbi:MAG: hypothetical protein AAF802_23070 [Planctomycetota bacterium]
MVRYKSELRTNRVLVWQAGCEVERFNTAFGFESGRFERHRYHFSEQNPGRNGGRVVSVSGGEVEIDRYTLFGWSDGAQLLWKDAKPDDQLTLEFESLSAGDYKLIYTIGPDYGSARIQHGDQNQLINGRFIGILSVLETRKVRIQINRNGSGQITVTIQGKKDGTYRFGLDAIVPK